MNEKELARYGILGLAVAALIYLFVWARKKGKLPGADVAGANILPVVPRPPQTGSDNGTVSILYDIDTGEGRAAIEARMKQIHATDRGKQLIAQASQDPYTGLAWKTDFKNAMASIFGNAYNVPVLPEVVNARYRQFLEGIKDQPKTVEELDREGDFNRALQIWQNALDFGEFSFWPANLAQQIEQGAFKASGPADRNRSERYDVFTIDAKKFANNLLTLQRQYEDALQKAAIQDLRAQGWKFQGLDSRTSR